MFSSSDHNLRAGLFRRVSPALGVVLFPLLAAPLPAQELTVAAASDLQFVLPVIAAEFQQRTGHSAKLVFASSGSLYAQLENGAPFDVFLSADTEYPNRLVADRRAEAGTLVRYAAGKLVLWVRKESPLDPAEGLRVLLDPRVQKIALANPQHAPYGRAAVAALRRERLYEAVRGKFVLGENISQTAQFVESGNADVGILALSLVLAPQLKSLGKYAEISDSLYPLIEQGAVILSASRNKDAARQFLAFLKRPEIVARMRACGFAEFK